MATYGYSPIPGSLALKTRARAHDENLAQIEAAESASLQGADVGGQWLARTLVRTDFVPVLLDVFDRLHPRQSAEEQAVYGHLYRLSLAEERNHCRVSRRDLSARTNLSERRLGKALAGLVQKDHIRLVSRDKRGTLYRVLLPYEVFGEVPPDSVWVAKRRQKEKRPQTLAKTAAKPQPRVAAEDHPAHERMPSQRGPRPPHRSGKERLLKSQSVGELAAAFVAVFGRGPGRQVADVVGLVMDRMEEGVPAR
jgi:hypothetical protein